MWRKREIKIEEGKYKNCGGGGGERLKLWRRRENIKIEEERIKTLRRKT